MKYEKELSAIPFYQVHPEYKPFIGEDYDKYRILLIGESHYIWQTPDDVHFPLSYFEEHWWDGTCDELHQKNDGWYTTRKVVDNYRKKNGGGRYGIFTNPIKSFSDVVLHQKVKEVTIEERQTISCFAFMNFYQMPAVFEAVGFEKSIRKSARQLGWTKAEVDDALKEITEKSSEVVDAVIKAIDPKLIVFVSKAAYDAYIECPRAAHKDDPRVKASCHPWCPQWYRSGKEIFENYLREFIVKE